MTPSVARDVGLDPPRPPGLSSPRHHEVLGNPRVFDGKAVTLSGAIVDVQERVADGGKRSSRAAGPRSTAPSTAPGSC